MLFGINMKFYYIFFTTIKISKKQFKKYLKFLPNFHILTSVEQSSEFIKSYKTEKVKKVCQKASHPEDFPWSNNDMHRLGSKSCIGIASP